MKQATPLHTPDGVALHLQHWPAPGAARGWVQIVHGLGEHIGRYADVAAALNAQRWHVIGHDHRGHGRSGGPRGGLPQPDALLADVAQVHDHAQMHQQRQLQPAALGAQVLLGHSLGGLVAARFVAESLAAAPAPWARRFDALALSSPALDIGMRPLQKLLLALLGGLAPQLRLGNCLKPAWISRDPAVVQAYTADPLVHDRVTPALVRFMLDAGTAVQAAAPRWAVPTLLMWAGADRCVLAAGSATFAAAAPPSAVTAQAWPGLAHEIFNEPERQQLLARLTDWLARLPVPQP
ncbi:MAG: alpha/beta hydrolase [Rubrivivax sp.]|nr:alpha/beta hydrolase [Rubrivivax sp.]